MAEQEYDGLRPGRSSFQAINRPSQAPPQLQIKASSSSRRTSQALTADAAVEEKTAAPSSAAVASRLHNKASASRIASPALSSDTRTSRTPVQEDSGKSEPMTRAPSTSSQHSSKDVVPGAASYGTRSRNRPRASRPNYAEDIELDFEAQTVVNVGTQEQDNSSMDTSSHSPVALESRQSPAPAASSKRTAGAGSGWNAVNKDGAIPGTSTFSANSTTTAMPSRKRKAAAVATQTPLPATNSLPAPASTSHKKRGGTTTQVPLQGRETNMVSFDKCKTTLNRDGVLISDDGVTFAINDHIYLICEPPGEPYYIGRIMEFRCQVPDDHTTPVEYLRINWVYRPRDVQRFVNDSRLVYVTMHSDLCPLTSLRGKCQVRHRSEIQDVDEYRKLQNAFWFNQCFDRFIHRWYEVIPVAQVINVPQNVKKALDERWKYVVLETTRVKELTSEVKSCKRCSGYCALDDSVECAVCRNTYHMNCVRPPLLKKPSRGFAWACAPCSRAQERRLEARRTPNTGEIATDAEEDEILEEEEEDTAATDRKVEGQAGASEDRTVTDAEVAHAKMWPMRYLGIHCRVEDVLQYEDRAIYPRASSRLGPKHQANTPDWYGRPLELVKPVEIKKKYLKGAGNKKDTKLSKETQLAIEADKEAKAKRPPWVQDEPVGYLARGEDLPADGQKFSAKLLFRMPTLGEHSSRGEGDAPLRQPEHVIDAYMTKARKVAFDIGVEPHSTDFLDRAIYLLQQSSFDSEAALRQLKKTNPVGSWPRNRLEIRKDLREPRLILKDDEKKRFEEGVSRYGSELRSVRQHVRTVCHADIVRYWYYWKKTSRGKKIWGSYGGRKNISKKKAESKDDSAKLLDDIADAQDDSAFDNEKVLAHSRKMICKHCDARRSRFWRRAPGVTPGQTVLADGRGRDKGSALMLALCQRCAKLWRRYAVQWEDSEEMAKKISQGGGRAWKRRVDEELICEWKIAQENPGADQLESREQQAVPQLAPEPPRKKVKGAAIGAEDTAVVEAPKKKPLPPPPPPPPKREPTPPLIPAEPKMKNLPCAICYDPDTTSENLLSCRDCRLAVHRNCYGVSESRAGNKWSCDPCSNDRREVATLSSSADPAAYRYKCVLCPIEVTEQSLVEPPKISHKKKTDREREKERLEKELADRLAEDYVRQQKERGRPIQPREPLKRTADNKWVHVTCSLWTPEIKYSNAKTLEVAEGIPLIPKPRREQICKLCKSAEGACVTCHNCHGAFHIACAHQHGYTFGFDVTPVKSSRRDGVNIVTLGETIGKPETGTLAAAIWCREHSLSSIKTIPHLLNELVDNSGSGLIALQLFAQNYKQADLTLTGTARKASFLDELTKSNASMQPAIGGNRRVSTNSTTATRAGRNSSIGLPQHMDTREGEVHQSSLRVDKLERHCASCTIDVSPRWWKHEPKEEPENNIHGQGTQSTQRPPTREDGPGLASNGVKPEVQPNAGSSMQIDGGSLLHRPGLPPSNRSPNPSPIVTNGHSREASISTAYDCNKCHWRRMNPPEDVQESAPGSERNPTPPAPVASPPRRPLPTQLWTGMPNQPPQPQAHAQPHGWPSYTNGGMPTPQTAIQQQGPHHPIFIPLGSRPPPPPPPPGFFSRGPPPGLSTRSPYGMASAPSSLHALVQGLSNGHPPPHMALLSGTHAPIMQMMSRQSDGPFAGPAPHQLGDYGHHHSNTGPPPMQTARDPPPMASTPRIVHGASASPNVRNILND